ncbi:uncharacterized protein LOC131329810 [Rhododendron vialii]|uniref:uncharacterized protein LOC131329810 n=1 Tax=Rhododendron vialii TaxID=182163 RepID=UPI00265DFADA|nr:uncharacterized protein LOC131329810 [Rhododendron vialii]
MEAALTLGVEKLKVIGDSNLVVSQANGDWKVREQKLKLYHQDLEDLIPHFNKVTFTHIPRLKNQCADALATLASMVELPLGVKLRPILIELQDCPTYQYVNAVNVVDDGLPCGEYPAEAFKKDQLALRRIAAQYILCGGKLYKRSHCGMHKLCVNGSEAARIMEEVHEGVCGPHMSGVMLARKILWPSTSNGHRFILVAIDYLTKWVEAESYKTLTAVQVAHFIKKNIIYRYSVPQAFVSDNGTHFKGRVLELFEEFKTQVHHSTVYRPQTNGGVKAANKNIETIIKKSAESARDWHEQLPLALWGYRTSIRTSTGVTPYSLVYGMEAVLPIKLEVPSLRIMAECGLTESEWFRGRFVELMPFDERRLRALHHVQGYQRRIARAFNKKVKSRDLVEGDMVTKEIRAPVFDPRGKFRLKRSGPYIIKTILSGGAAQLIDLDGNEFSTLVNLHQLKRYYP